MRMRYAKFFTFFLIILNIIIVYYAWQYFVSLNLFAGVRHGERFILLSKNASKQLAQQHLQSKNRQQINTKKSITIIFREFYAFDNDLKTSISNILNLFPTVPVLILYDEEPYPPIDIFINQTTVFPHANLKFHKLDYDVTRKFHDLNPATLVKTKYALLMPDSVRLSGRGVISKIVRLFNGNSMERDYKMKMNSEMAARNGHGSNEKHDKKIFVIPFKSSVSSMGNCCHVDLDLINWTVRYNISSGTEKCDMILQKHAILVEAHVLRMMSSAFEFPFPEMFYFQAKKFHMKKTLINITLQDGKPLFTTYHSKQQMMEIRRDQFKMMYKKLKVKKVVSLYSEISYNTIELKSQLIGPHKKKSRTKTTVVGSLFHPNINLNYNYMGNFSNAGPTLTRKNVIYYGCERNSTSCIGKVFNAKPFYVYQGKHTPPCCLEKLKQIFDHVLSEFENVGIRYWLDNSALKSAIEINSLAFDAFEIDIAFNNFDLMRSTPLKKSQSRPFTDEKEFYWIKATEGNYFRVQYSKVNQISVNLLPFDVVSDRVKPSGFYGWKAKEFSVEFLHPMSTVLFLGKNVMCPNNVREFVDLKGTYISN